MPSCIFCNLEQERILFETEHFFIVKDNYPVSSGHILIISKRHSETYFNLTHEETINLSVALTKAKELIVRQYTPDGYNIGMNCGTSAGQSVMHFHYHLIPRYTGDVENPRGGVRHVIPGKGNY